MTETATRAPKWHVICTRGVENVNRSDGGSRIKAVFGQKKKKLSQNRRNGLWTS